MIRRSALFILVLLCLGTSAPGSAVAGPADQEGSDEGLVRVDGSTITREELEAFFNAFFFTEEVRDQVSRLPQYQQEAAMARGRSQALNELVRRRLLLNAAEEQFLTNKQVEAMVDELTENRLEEMRKEAGSHVEFVQGLHEQGMSLRQWKRFVRETILIQNFMWERTRTTSRVRPVEMRRYYREHSGQFRRPRQVVYRMIIVDPDKCEAGQEEGELAEKIHRKLREGADFAELANEYSLDRDRREGGLHTVDSPADDPHWLPPICRDLETGQISAIRKTSAGYSIARLEEIIPAGIAPFEAVQDEIHERLLENRERRVREELVEKLREEAHVKVLPAGEELFGS